MKKIIIYTALFLSLTSSSFAEEDPRVDINSICSNFSIANNAYIRYGQQDQYKFVGSCGSNDNDCWKNFPVRQIQNFLALQYQLPSTFPTGYFGPRTHYYMQKFKKENRLTPVSTVGPATIAKIKEVCGNKIKKEESVEASICEQEPAFSGGCYMQITSIKYDSSLNACIPAVGGGCTVKAPFTSKVECEKKCVKKIVSYNNLPLSSIIMPKRVLVGDAFPLKIDVQPVFLTGKTYVKYVVDWGDGSGLDTQSTPEFRHTYVGSGRYSVSVGVSTGKDNSPKLESYNNIDVIDRNRKSSCDAEYLESLRKSEVNSCPLAGGWLLKCPNGEGYENLALSSCMLKDLQGMGWELPGIHMPVGR